MNSRIARVPPACVASIVVLAGCLHGQPAPATSATPKPAIITREAFEAQQAAVPKAPACAQMGPFSCDLEPSNGDDLCLQLARCLGAHDPAKANIKVAGCGELGSFETAPAETGIKRVAVVNVDGSVDGATGQGSYLVAEREGGFCVVDQAVRWQALPDGYLDTDSRLAFHQVQGKTLLSVRTQALRFNDDEDEDGANVRAALCRDAEYAIDGGRFVSVGERAVNEPCNDD